MLYLAAAPAHEPAGQGYPVACAGDVQVQVLKVSGDLDVGSGNRAVIETQGVGIANRFIVVSDAIRAIAPAIQVYIVADTIIQDVITGTTLQQVVTRASVQVVITTATDNDVVAALPVKLIGATQAAQEVAVLTSL